MSKTPNTFPPDLCVDINQNDLTKDQYIQANQSSDGTSTDLVAIDQHACTTSAENPRVEFTLDSNAFLQNLIRATKSFVRELINSRTIRIENNETHIDFGNQHIYVTGSIETKYNDVMKALSLLVTQHTYEVNQPPANPTHTLHVDDISWPIFNNSFVEVTPSTDQSSGNISDFGTYSTHDPHAEPPGI